MGDYTKQLPSGRYVAKRGYCYFLYETLQEVEYDDAQVNDNLNRLNRGISDWCYNRCESGIWLAKARRLRDLKCLEKTLLGCEGF